MKARDSYLHAWITCTIMIAILAHNSFEMLTLKDSINMPT